MNKSNNGIRYKITIKNKSFVDAYEIAMKNGYVKINNDNHEDFYENVELFKKNGIKCSPFQIMNVFVKEGKFYAFNGWVRENENSEYTCIELIDISDFYVFSGLSEIIIKDVI